MKKILCLFLAALLCSVLPAAVSAQDAATDFAAAAADGVPEEASTTGLLIHFEQPVTGLTKDKITLIPRDGGVRITTGNLTDNGHGDYRLDITDIDITDVKTTNADAANADTANAAGYVYISVQIDDWDGWRVVKAPRQAVLYKETAVINVRLDVEQIGGADGLSDTQGLRVKFTSLDRDVLLQLPTANEFTLSLGETEIMPDRVEPDGHDQCIVYYHTDVPFENGSVISVRVTDWAMRHSTDDRDVFRADNIPSVKVFRDTRSYVDYEVSAVNDNFEDYDFSIETRAIKASFSLPVPRRLVEGLTFTNVSLGEWTNVNAGSGSGGSEISDEWQVSVTEVLSNGKSSVASQVKLTIPPDDKEFKTQDSRQVLTLYKDVPERASSIAKVLKGAGGKDIVYVKQGQGEGYKILAVMQGSDKKLAVQLYSSESELEAGLKNAGSALITFRGDITSDDVSYQVHSGSTLNHVIDYVSNGKSILVSSINGEVSVTADDGNLKFGNFPLTPNVPFLQGFTIELDGSQKYLTERNGIGDTAVEIRSNLSSDAWGLEIQGISIHAEAVKLYKDSVSIAGEAAIKVAEFGLTNENEDDVERGKVAVTLHEMILGSGQDTVMGIPGVPRMNAEGEIAVDIGKYVGDTAQSTSSDNLGRRGALLRLKYNTIDTPAQFNLRGEVALKKLYIEAELGLAQRVQNGVRSTALDAIYFFIRAVPGIPVLPSAPAGAIYGGGGGISGLAYFRGYYDGYVVNPIKVKLATAFYDITRGAVFDARKVELTLGQSEFSAFIRDAALLKVITFKDVGLAIGQIEPAKNSAHPDKADTYVRLGGSFNLLDGSAGWIKFLRDKGFYLRGSINGLFQNHASTTGRNEVNVKGDAQVGVMLPIANLEGNLGLSFNSDSSPLFSGALNFTFRIGWRWFSVSVNGKIGMAFYPGDRLQFTSPIGNPSISLRSAGVNADNAQRGQLWPSPLTLSIVPPASSEAGELKTAGSPEPQPEEDAKADSLQIFMPNVYALGMYKPAVPYKPAATVKNASRALTDGVSVIEGEAERITIPNMVLGDMAVLYSTEKPGFIKVYYNGTEQDPPFAAQWDDVMGVPGYEDDAGLSATQFIVPSDGEWAFEADGLLDSMHVKIFPMPSFQYVEAGLQAHENLEVIWNIQDTDDVDPDAELKVKLLLMDANTDEIVSSLTDLSGGYAEAGIGEFHEAAIPKTLPSGPYYVSAELFYTAEAENPETGETEQMDITLDMKDSDVFTYTNSFEPGTPANVRAEYNGNGSFTVAWNPVPQADGYSVTVLSENGAPLDGVGHVNVEGDAAEVTLTSDFVTVDSNEPDTPAEAFGLEHGKTYQLSVQAYKKRIYKGDGEGEEDDTSILIFGEEETCVYTIPIPEIPLLTLTANDGTPVELKDENGEVTNTVVALNEQNVTLTAVPSAKADIDFYLTGDTKDELIASGTAIEAGQPFTFTHTFEENGMYALYAKAVNSENREDRSRADMNLIVDTTPPVFNVDDASFTAWDGKISVTGFVEEDAALTVNGEPLDPEDGYLMGGLFKFESVTDASETQVRIAAMDLAGNIAARELTILSASSTDPFVPVSSITGVPTSAVAGTPLILTGTVNPPDASNKALLWSVVDAGGTGATLLSGNLFNARAAGIAKVSATIARGTATGSYTQNFDITVQAGQANRGSIGGQEFDLTGNASGTGWSWNAASKTLSLTGGGTDLGAIALTADDDVTVNAAGGSVTASSIVNAGSGKLTVTGAQGTSLTLNAPAGPAISANGDVEINSGAVYASTLSENADAISAGGSVTIGGTASVSAETVNGGGSAVSSAANVNISTSGNMKAKADAGFDLEAAAIHITNGRTELVFNESSGGGAFNNTPAISGNNTTVTVNGRQVYPSGSGSASGTGGGCNAIDFCILAVLLTLPLLGRGKK